MKTIIFIISISLLSISALWMISPQKGETNKIKSDLPSIFQPPIPEEVDFCGERIPLENPEVRERLDREIVVNTYWHSSTILLLKRYKRWSDEVRTILRKQNIPEDMIYLLAAESGFTNSISPAGAAGFWQFMKDAAGKYGLEVNDETDERYNLQKATEAACAYLRDSYSLYGSWTLAAASYNGGTNGLSRRLSEQKVNSFYDLSLPEETSRYIFRIAAIKTILNHPLLYGYDLKESELYQPLNTREIIIKSTIPNLAEFALQNNTNLRILKYLNPWLRNNSLKVKPGIEYKIKLPKEN